MVTLTEELLESWSLFNLISEELLPIGVEQLFEASIPTEDKIQLLLHEEVLGRRGMVYVAAKAARRACTKTGWNHPDSLRALDLCDQYASGEEIPEEELRAAEATAANANAPRASNAVSSAASWASSAASWGFSEAPWAASRAAFAVSRVSRVASEVERRAQLEDCREWLEKSVREKAAISTRYQRILGWKASE